MRRFLILSLSILITIPARANLGEDVKSLVARYGAPKNYSEAHPGFPFGTLIFAASGITLIVFLEDEKEVGAKVFKTNGKPFSDEERQAIMATDGGSQWVEGPNPDATTRQWSRPDKATVMYDSEKNLIIFTSAEMAKAVDSITHASAGQAASPAAPAAPVPSAPAYPIAPAAPSAFPSPTVPTTPAAPVK